MWLFAALGAGNLPSAERLTVEIVLVAGALVVGSLGARVAGRHLDEPHVVLFFATSGAITGAICGGAYALVIGILYVVAYGGAPVDALDGIALVVAFPVFAALGGLIGVFLGGLLGACLGFVASRAGLNRSPLGRRGAGYP